MNKLLPFALALALALPGCAAVNTVPQPPETPTTTTETAAEAPAESTLPGLTGRLRQTSYDTAAVGQTFYGMMSTYDDETLTSVYTIIATDTAANTQQKAAELETQGYYTSLAAWQDGLELYIDDWLDETGQPVTNSYQNGDITSWRYKIDPTTGQMERLEVEGAPYSPQWQDDAAVYAERSVGQWIECINRLDHATGQQVDLPLPSQTQSVYDAIGQRWLIGRIISPGPMPDYTTDRDAFFAMWQNSQLEIDLYDPATRACEKLFETPCYDGEKWMYSGQRDGVPYFIHYTATEDQSYTMAVGLDKLENGTMTTVYTPQSDQWPELESYGQDGEERWVVEYLRDSIAIYDLADGQTYTPTVDHDNYIGYPIQLLPDDRVVVTNGWYETTAATDRQPALVTIDMTAYLNGSTDYTPIEMYTSK